MVWLTNLLLITCSHLSVQHLDVLGRVRHEVLEDINGYEHKKFPVRCLIKKKNPSNFSFRKLFTVTSRAILVSRSEWQQEGPLIRNKATKEKRVKQQQQQKKERKCSELRRD